MKIERILPWAVGALALAAVAIAARPQREVRGLDLAAFGRLPILEGGRVKPVDSFARNSLLMIRSQQSFRHEGRTVNADEWLLDVMFRPQVAARQPVFNVDDPEVLGLMGRQQSSNRYLSFVDLSPHLEELQRQADAARQVDAKQRTRFQAAIVNLFERVYLFYRIGNTVQLVGATDLAAEAAQRSAPGAVERHRALAELAAFRPIPAPAGGSPEAWRSVGEALLAGSTGALDPSVARIARLGAAYVAADGPAFNQAVAELRAAAGSSQPEALRHADHESVFNRVQPFYNGMVIYVLALLAVFVSWLWRPALLQRTAFALLLAGAVVHTAGLASRVILQGRPPVTNLYSSAVFVGWAAVILGIVLERMYRRGFASAVAAASGFSSLLVAHHLTGDGDTMEMMRAVLDSNFWLATHVITITIGYSGMFLAGAIAIAYAVRRHVVATPDHATTKTLVSMTYGITCFALFFSFIGTVLGGIWADQSWGRFWGWDPKENGALLIVLWTAIILHARWGGFVREKGLMAMAIVGNVVTSLSWFGVNMLGVGLHSYGFMDKAFWALSGFIASQLVLMGACLVPPQFWRARAAAAHRAPKAGPEATGA